MRKYEFPAKRNDIDNCYDVEQLKQWQHGFEQTMNQIDADYGGIENVPGKIYRYVKANELNLKQINYKIFKLTNKVSSVGALKCFHDTMKELMPNEYGIIVEQAKIRLGKRDFDWEELISKKNHDRRI